MNSIFVRPRIINRVTYCYLMVCMFAFFYSPTVANDTGLTIYANDNFYPYSFYHENKQYEGLSIDLLSAINSNILVQNKITSQISDSQLIDVYAFINPLKVPVGFTFLPIPHNLEYYVFTRKATGVKALTDLFNQRIILVKGDLPIPLLEKYNTNKIYLVSNYKVALEMLSAGINDCAIVPKLTGFHIINEMGLKNLEYIETPFLTEQGGIAIKNNRTELIHFIETGINTIIANNDYQILQKKWLTDQPSPFESSTSKFYILVIIGILLLLIIVLIGYIWVLKSDVDANTEHQIKHMGLSTNSPMLLDLDSIYVQKILDRAPIWAFINNKAGQIVKVSREFLVSGLKLDVLPENLTIQSVFNEHDSNILFQLDEKAFNQRNQMVIHPVTLSLSDQTFTNWLIKYPVRFIGTDQILILNILIKPLVEGGQLLRKMSPNVIFKTILDALPDMVYYKNQKGQYLGANKAFYKTMQKTEADVIGKTDLEIFNAETSELNAISDKSVFDEGTPWEGILWHTNVNKEKIKFELSKIPLRDKDKSIFAILGISHDVTEHYTYQLELAKAKDKAEESDRIKSSFLANMSHEVRTPMNNIIGFSDLLADHDLTYDQRVEIIDMIQNNGYRLIDLIDDIIDFSKIEAGQIHLKYSDFNLNSLITDAFSYGNGKKVQVGKDTLTISVSLGAIADDFQIHSDPFRLRQVFKNIMNASIRFTTSESVYLGYEIYENDIFIYVLCDNTIPLAEMYENLLTSDSADKITFSNIEQSSEIALIIAKKAVEMIGGKIQIDGVNAGRPQIVFTIPYIRGESGRNRANVMPTSEKPNWEGATILIAEDEETNYILLESIIERTNATIIRATNGREAVSLYAQNKFDLVLMDIRMPEMNGIEATRKILDADPNAIIVAQTAYAMSDEKEQYLKVGMKNVLTKPIDPAELYYTCSRLLKSRK